MTKVKIGTAFTTTTNAAFLMPKYLKDAGVDAQIISFPSLVQRMQAVASGDVDVGNGGLSATMQVDTKGFPMNVLANGCDGGWMVVANKSIATFADLKGKKIAVQNGSIGLVSLKYKLQQEGLTDAVELVFMDNQDQPIPLMRGDVAAMCCFEPYATLATINGWGKPLWVPYDTPMGKTNLGFVASAAFVKKNPELTRKIVTAHVAATKELIDTPAIAVQTTIDQFKMSREIAEASTKKPLLLNRIRPRVPVRPESPGQNDDREQDAGQRTQLGHLHQHQLPARVMQAPAIAAAGAYTTTPRKTRQTIEPKRLLGLLPLLTLLAAWQTASWAEIYPPILLPSPERVAMAFVTNYQDVLVNAFASVTRVITGVSIAFIVAVPAGLLIGRYRILDQLTDWSIQIFRSVPPIAMIPMALLFFGIGDKPAIVLIFLAALWPLLINTIFGVRGIERTLIKVARAARASEWLIFRDIILPAAMPAVFNCLRLDIGGGWLTVVTAEMIAVKSGLGYMILNAQLTFRSELIIAGIVVIGAIGLLADQGVRALRGYICRWQEGLTATAE
jgi:ABC-type nitrate/sulfonate/bicarbonate transport system permease component/ABC-type nitrate/sulfonate/bicarbonate transport system substrate-binding protein